MIAVATRNRAAGSEADAFLARVGERVREARQRRRLSRKALSDLSRVSLRYLAQLEAGSGNMSLALLHRVAAALGCPVETLVGDPASAEAARVAALYGAATAAQRLKAMQALSPDDRERLRQGRVALIGLRGAGKSTLGRRLGERLDAPFVEINREIARQSGMPVAEVMALYGQEGYRRLERQEIERAAARPGRVVIAVAGGIVGEADTYALLLRSFHSVWLRAAPEEHMARVRAQGDERPMAGNPKAMEALNAILRAREALYARADVTVDTSGRTVEESLADLAGAVERLAGFAEEEA